MISTRTKAYVGVIALVAVIVTVAVGVVTPPASSDGLEAAVFFCLAAFVAHGLAYRLPGGGFGDITFIPLLSGVTVAPGFPTVIGTCAALLCAEYVRRREPVRVIFNAAQLTVAVGLAVAVYVAAGGAPLTTAGIENFAPFVAAFGAFFISNALMFAGVVALTSQQPFSHVLARALGGTSLIYDLIGIPIVFGFAYAYVRIGWGWSGALLLPLFGIRQVYKANRELQTVNEELLQLMVTTIEARDPYTSGHSQRVAKYSRVVAKAAMIGLRATDRVYTAALLHDVGKIHEEFAPILRKPGRLTVEEFAVMKTHAEKGAALVGKVSQFEDLIPAVRGHHEAWDGSGYPAGLKGDAIPLWARIIAIADTIDAMTTDRPYRLALKPEAVRDELQKHAGRQFDPRIAGLLISDARWPEMEDVLAGTRAAEIQLSDAPSGAAYRHSAARAEVV
jgi:putative nucleotidyltransferase with HDIG domain